MSLQVYVGNYPSTFTSDDLLDLFRDFKGIELKAFKKVDKKSYSFLVCIDKEQVIDIVTSMHAVDVCGRNLIVRASDKELQNLILSESLLDNDAISKHPRNTNNKHSVILEKKGNYGINYKPCTNYEVLSGFPDGVRFNNPRLHFSQTAKKDINVCQKQGDSRQSTVPEFKATIQSERGNKSDSQGNFSTHCTRERPTSAQTYYKHVRPLNSPDQGSGNHNYNLDSNNDSGVLSYSSKDCNNDLQIVDEHKPSNFRESITKPLFNQNSGTVNYSLKDSSNGHQAVVRKNGTDCKQSIDFSSHEKNIDYKTGPISYYPEDSVSRRESPKDYVIGSENSDFTNGKSTDTADSLSYYHQHSEIYGQNASIYKGHLVDDDTQSRPSYYQDSGIHEQNGSNFNSYHQVEDCKQSRQSCVQDFGNRQNSSNYASGRQLDDYRHSSSDCSNVKTQSVSYYNQDSGIHGKHANYYNNGHLVDDCRHSRQSYYNQDSEFHGKDSKIHLQNSSTCDSDQVDDYRQSSSACSNAKTESYYQDENCHNVRKSAHDNGVDVSDSACATDLSVEQVSKDDLFYVSVANFPLYTSVDDLYELFEDFDPYDIVMICNYPRADKKPTEAIICFETQNLATDAILNFDNTSYYGRGLVVTDATDISMVPTLLNMGSSNA